MTSAVTVSPLVLDLWQQPSARHLESWSKWVPTALLVSPPLKRRPLAARRALPRGKWLTLADSALLDLGRRDKPRPHLGVLTPKGRPLAARRALPRGKWITLAGLALLESGRTAKARPYLEVLTLKGRPLAAIRPQAPRGLLPWKL